MMSRRQLRVILSGGGTGGHIFPAVAIANALRRVDEKTEVLFVGAEGRMEMEKVPAAGYKIEGLWISGIQRRLTLKNLLIPFKIISSILKAKRIIKSFKPDVVIGTGGYASGPTLRAAAGMHIPCLIQEQNSFPGVTNKLLAKKVRKICVAYEGMEKYFPKDKIILTGNPVRQDIINVRMPGKREEAMKFFGLDPQKKVVLVIGGSLGARTINEGIITCLESLKKNSVQLIWQTGKGFIATAKDAVKGRDGLEAFDFISRMDLAYAASDIVVSRAGAISVSEICVSGKAAILIPSPNVAEDHQTKNAKALEKKGAAILLKDNEAKEKLNETLEKLIANEEKQKALEKAALELAIPDSADRIAKEVLELVK